MSKQSKRKARRRRQHRDTLRYEMTCPACHAVEDGTPASVLAAVVDTLNIAADNGSPLRAWHGILKSADGYVLPYGNGRWTARTLTYDRFPDRPAPVFDDGFED